MQASLVFSLQVMSSLYAEPVALVTRVQLGENVCLRFRRGCRRENTRHSQVTPASLRSHLGLNT